MKPLQIKLNSIIAPLRTTEAVKVSTQKAGNSIKECITKTSEPRHLQRASAWNELHYRGAETKGTKKNFTGRGRDRNPSLRTQAAAPHPSKAEFLSLPPGSHSVNQQGQGREGAGTSWLGMLRVFLAFPCSVPSLPCFFPPVLFCHPCSPRHRSRLENVEYFKLSSINHPSVPLISISAFLGWTLLAATWQRGRGWFYCTNKVNLIELREPWCYQCVHRPGLFTPDPDKCIYCHSVILLHAFHSPVSPPLPVSKMLWKIASSGRNQRQFRCEIFLGVTL